MFSFSCKYFQNVKCGCTLNNKCLTGFTHIFSNPDYTLIPVQACFN